MTEILPAPQTTDYPELDQNNRGDISPRPDRLAAAPLPAVQPKPDYTYRPLPAATDDWQAVLWREWRNTPDAAYADHLFELIGDAPVGRLVTLTNSGLGLVYGGGVGLLTGWLLNLAPVPLAVTGLLLGGGAGFILGKIEAGLSWRKWLARLTSNLSPKEFGLWLVVLALSLVGAQIGWLLGWAGGIEQAIGFVAVAILLAAILETKLISWLVGMSRKPNPRYLHQYKKLWYWWRNQPDQCSVQSALQRAAQLSPGAHQSWQNLLQTLAQAQAGPDVPEKYVDQLDSRHWQVRFIATQLLASSGGEAVAALAPLANRITSPLRKTAIRLLKAIERETTSQLAHRAGRLLCPRCLAFFGPHQINAGGVDLTFYGCRLCGQSRTFWEGEVIAVLDETMGATPQLQPGVVRVSWLARRELFDFHTVEIGQTSDEAAERFAVQVGNDTDPLRRGRYKQLTCQLGPACRLSANTRRILARTFGKVVSQ